MSTFTSHPTGIVIISWYLHQWRLCRTTQLLDYVACVTLIPWFDNHSQHWYITTWNTVPLSLFYHMIGLLLGRTELITRRSIWNIRMFPSLWKYANRCWPKMMILSELGIRLYTCNWRLHHYPRLQPPNFKLQTSYMEPTSLYHYCDNRGELEALLFRVDPTIFLSPYDLFFRSSRSFIYHDLRSPQRQTSITYNHDNPTILLLTQNYLWSALDYLFFSVPIIPIATISDRRRHARQV